MMSALNPFLDWLAPAATVIGAMMTAANLGTRVTGWGFAIFLLASLAWTALGISTGQTSLIYANAFLIVVNAIGVWRWLGRQASYDEDAAKAAKRSLRERIPTLFSFNSLIGAEVEDKQGNRVGAIVDIMGTCADREIAYFVISEGGVGGLGERLHAVWGARFDLSRDTPSIDLDAETLKILPILENGAWPTRI